MPTPTRSISRRTAGLYHGRRLVLEVPPSCDVVSVRLAGTRTRYDVHLQAIYHMAVKQAIALKKAEAKAKRKKFK